MSSLANLPDFWVAFPEAEAIESFRNLRDKRENSGAILYYFMYFNDPKHEHLRLLKPEERKEELKKWLDIKEDDLYNTKGQMYSFVQKAEDWYLKNWLDPTARLLNAHTEKVNQSTKVVEDYSVDSTEKLKEYSAILESSQIIKENYDKLLRMYKSTEAVKQKHGGGAVGAADSGDIFEGL